MFTGLQYSGAFGQCRPSFPVFQFIRLQYSVLCWTGRRSLYTASTTCLDKELEEAQVQIAQLERRCTDESQLSADLRRELEARQSEKELQRQEVPQV